jgi:methylthioribose-1-phosphate isomerase
MTMRSIAWQEGAVQLLDQTVLPHETRLLRLADWRQVADAIAAMRIRGAPAIGAAGAYAVALAAQEALSQPDSFAGAVREAASRIRGARPTAVNLAWAVDRMMALVSEGSDPAATADRLLQEAHRIAGEDAEANRRLGAIGAERIGSGERILTICNTGALATVGVGTAFGILRAAHEAGKGIHVFACETRPFLQGSRLTAWELLQHGIPFHLITDSAAGWLMARGIVDRVITGADRVAANGDVANKIGTYTLAVLARHHKIPFWVASPLSTVDPQTRSGEAIPIEERDPCEVTHFHGKPVAPDGTAALNYAFDVTPAELISAIVTEAGIASPPYDHSLHDLLAGASHRSGAASS